MGSCSDSGHTLHDIKHRALNLQQAEFFAIDAESDISGFDGIAIVQELLHAAFRVEVIDNLLRHLYTGNYSCIFDDKLLAAHLCWWDATEGGMVAVTNIFLKPKGNQFT